MKKMFDALSVSKKFLVSTSILVLLIAGVGLFSMYGFMNAQSSIESIYTDNMTKSNAINLVSRLLATNIREMQLASQHNPSLSVSKIHEASHSVDAHVENIKSRAKEIEAAWSSYKKLGVSSSEEEKQAYEFQTNYSELIKAMDVSASLLQEAMLAGDSSHYEKSDLNIAQVIRPLFDKSQKNLIVILDIQNKLAQEEKNSSDRFAKNYKLIMACVGVVTILGLLLSIFVTRRVTKPLECMSRTVSTIAETGDLGLRVEFSGRDEVGKTAGALNTFLDTLQRLLGTLGEIEKTGDLTLRMTEFGQTSQVTNTLLGSLESAFRQITEAANKVGQSAKQMNTASQNMSSNAIQQSAAAEEVTASAEETSSQVKANAEAANTANQLVMGASQAANEGQSKMNAMTTAMNEINNSAREIAKIIKVIDEIAFQTNLLALNAAVEAARAGQHGRGFAVVAQEVRNLAGRSAKAAKETAELIDKSVRQVEGGVTVANETGEALAQIVGNVLKVKDLVAEIAAASQEQSRGVAQINVAIAQVATGAQEGSKQSEELSASADDLSAAAEGMLQEISRFKVSAVHLGTVEKAVVAPPSASKSKPALTTAKKSATKALPHKSSPKSILPLDHDERGFGDF